MGERQSAEVMPAQETTVDVASVYSNIADANMQDAEEVADGINNTDLSPEEVASLTALSERHGLTLHVILETARASKRRAAQGGTEPASMVDEPPVPPAPSLSVRTVIQQVRMRSHIPLPVEPYSDGEWEAIEPHFRWCKSRTLPRRTVLWSAIRYSLGHAASKRAADLTVSAFLSYEVARYGGSRVKALADAMEGVLADHRCRELQALVTYLEERARNRTNWQSMSNA